MKHRKPHRAGEDRYTFAIPKDFHITTQTEYEAKIAFPTIPLPKSNPFRTMIRNILWEIREARDAFAHLRHAIYWEVEKYIRAKTKVSP